MADPIEGVTRQAEATLTTRFGDFTIAVFEVEDAPGEVAALMHGQLDAGSLPLIRLHSE